MKKLTALTGSRKQIADYFSEQTDPWTDLALTLPILLLYHLWVVFLPVRNAADFVTSTLVRLANASLLSYVGITVAITLVFVGIIVLFGRNHKLHWQRLAAVVVEGTVYAIAMAWIAHYVVGKLRLVQAVSQGFYQTTSQGMFSGFVMSLGAGFYEEVVYRVVLFGLGLQFLMRFIPKHKVAVGVSWALVTSFIFSASHYVGTYGDDLTAASFVFRWICGICFVAVYRYRGFAPVVWCHTVYDIWVLVL